MSIEWQHIGMVLLGCSFFVLARLKFNAIYKRMNKILDLLEELTNNKEDRK